MTAGEVAPGRLDPGAVPASEVNHDADGRKVPERKYAMTRLAAGDYLLPSNDLSTMWRIVRYEDGKYHGLDVDWDRMFWRCERLPMADFERYTADPSFDWWAWPWAECSTMLPTRKAAIDAAMERS